jgi:membrane-associated protease RseP (regulator of RpoE activity)
MDRERIVNQYDYGQRDYEPVQPKSGFRELLRKIWAPILALLGLLLKLGSLAKFGAIFVAFGGYALIWGWKFALGVIVLIFLHEMGHFIEAWREGLNPSWPVFIPFLGAYVRYTGGNAWQTTRVAIAGPILGGIAALGFYVVGRAQGSQLLEALAYFGFFLNLINLLPIGILDGGAVWRATRYLWIGRARTQAIMSGVLYGGTALLLAIGAYAAYLPQHRL